MQSLGISVYPDRANKDDIEQYLKLASSLGYTKLFTCLISASKNKEQLMTEFSEFTELCHKYNFEVAADSNNEVFDLLEATPYDLKPFNEIGLDILRLDAHFDEQGDMAITKNPYNIKIQYNASSNIGLDNLIERGADASNMCMCHNFYPEPFSGLSEARFTELSKKYKALGLTIGAFVCSQESDTYGPWDLIDNLPTLEDDRHRPIDLQARHLAATGLVDEIIISDMFASEEELKALANTDFTKTCFKVELQEGISEAEVEDLFEKNHFTRPDASEYFLRSSFPRLDYRETSIPARNIGQGYFEKGDVMIPNDNFIRYRGEVEVALRDMPDDNTRNLAAKVLPEEVFLLDYIKPEYPFGFIKA